MGETPPIGDGRLYAGTLPSKCNSSLVGRMRPAKTEDETVMPVTPARHLALAHWFRPPVFHFEQTEPPGKGQSRMHEGAVALHSWGLTTPSQGRRETESS